jgi:predicted ATP-binding protein involved in virulence
MFIDEVTLKNFRGLGKVELKFDEHINLLVGVNGVGKSSVLEAMGIMLSTFTNRIKGTPGSSKKLTNDDIKSGRDVLNASLYMQFEGEPLTWSITRFSKDHGSGKNQSSELGSLNTVLKPLSIKLNNEAKKGDFQTSVPLVAYYSVNRLFRGKSKSDEKSIQKINYAPLEAYEKSVSIDGVYFNSLSNWFGYRQRYLDKKYNEDSIVNDSQLNSIEKAITVFLPEFSQLKYDDKLEELVIHKNHEILKLKQLSDGELCLIALIADIARRLAIANPKLTNPLEGKAIVLVDEIDLHLHPGWQRKLIDNFQRTFPKTQFIFSTHSPQMIGHVEPKNMWIFKRENNEVVAYRPEKSLGMDSNSILLQHLGVDEREPDTKEELRKLTKLVDLGDLESANQLVRTLSNKCGDIDELRRAKAIIKRKQLLGLDE